MFHYPWSDLRRSISDHAGPGNVLDTDHVSLVKILPPVLKTNVQPPAIRMAKRNIYLFPDRVLILDAAGFGAINYQQWQDCPCWEL
jgi:hypothetical protein